MPWKTLNIEQWAKESGVDLHEINQKLKLRAKIIQIRKQLELTQDEVAKISGVSRSRIAQIENGVKLHKMSFDVLLRVLQSLGCKYNITAKKLAA